MHACFPPTQQCVCDTVRSGANDRLTTSPEEKWDACKALSASLTHSNDQASFDSQHPALQIVHGCDLVAAALHQDFKGQRRATSNKEEACTRHLRFNILMLTCAIIRICPLIAHHHAAASEAGLPSRSLFVKLEVLVLPPQQCPHTPRYCNPACALRVSRFLASTGLETNCRQTSQAHAKTTYASPLLRNKLSKYVLHLRVNMGLVR